jgi:hypothetical protein
MLLIYAHLWDTRALDAQGCLGFCGLAAEPFYACHTAPLKYGAVFCYRTAMETSGLACPETLTTTGTASPGVTPAGTTALIW